MGKTITTFSKAREQNRKLVMITAYDYSMAKLFDSCEVDALLVGDSLGMVLLGYEDTLKVTMEDMIHHIKAVSKGSENTLVVGDLPFMSYQVSVAEAVRNAGRLIQEGGAGAVKLEGGLAFTDRVRAIVDSGIPVMGHLGLTPQFVNVFGGFKVQGRNKDKADLMLEEAKRIEDAGAFSIVLECIPEDLANRITNEISIPTIGIGAGAGCDGQVLVYHDMFGLYKDFKPKFVKRYADAGTLIKDGVKQYVKEVREGIFPDKSHSF